MPCHAMPYQVQARTKQKNFQKKRGGGEGVKSPQGKNQHVSPQVNILLFLPFNMYNKAPNPQT